MFIWTTFTETSIDETNKTQQKVRGSKFMFKMSTICTNTCIQTTTPLLNRWWFRWQCPWATQLHFLESGVKVNGDYYRNTVLLNMLLLDIRSVFWDYYVFQQDWAPAHRARDTITMLQRERRQSLSLQRCGHLIRQIWIRWTTASGVCFTSIAIQVLSNIYGSPHDVRTSAKKNAKITLAQYLFYFIADKVKNCIPFVLLQH